VAARIAAKLVRDVDINVEIFCCLDQDSQNFRDFQDYFFRFNRMGDGV